MAKNVHWLVAGKTFRSDGMRATAADAWKAARRVVESRYRDKLTEPLSVTVNDTTITVTEANYVAAIECHRLRCR